MDHTHQHDHDQHMPAAEDHSEHHGHSPSAFRLKFWLSLVLTIPTLVFSDTVQGWFGVSYGFSGSQYLPAVLGTAVFLYGGLVFIRGAWDELKKGLPGMMTLISMAILVAFGYSLAVTFGLVRGMDFWWELASLITIMLLGHWLEMSSIQSAEGALKQLAKLLPDTAELVDDGRSVKVAVAELKVNDHVLVRPGGKIPADGTVIKGQSEANEAMLTGESAPVAKPVGSSVIGGTINGDGALTIEVNKTSDSSVLSGIMKLVAEAQQSKSRAQVLADRAAFYLTFVAAISAVLTGLAWTLDGQSVEFILERIVTVLVIACPHALGLAVPLVTAISTTLAAQNGLLVRQRTALEAARAVDVVVFDKTGTLTLGQQGVVDMLSDCDAMEMLAAAAAVEAESEHPIARAIVEEAKKQALKLPEATGFASLPGRGARAKVSGKMIHVGGPQLIKQLGAVVPDSISGSAKLAEGEGKSIIYVIDAKTVCGAILVGDVIREESLEAVAQLQGMGKRVAMLTGDAEGVAAWVADKIGVDEYFAEVLPEHKAETILKMQQDGLRVAMVGDGVNDAPALATADVGIAIGAGTDVAIESAGIVLASDDPQGVAKIMKLSRATYRKMLQNLAWAYGYNAVAIPLAAGATAALGFVPSPAFGAVLMSVSTIIVAVNAQLLRRLRL